MTSFESVINDAKNIIFFVSRVVDDISPTSTVIRPDYSNLYNSRDTCTFQISSICITKPWTKSSPQHIFVGYIFYCCKQSLKLLFTSIHATRNMVFDDQAIVKFFVLNFSISSANFAQNYIIFAANPSLFWLFSLLEKYKFWYFD